MADLEGEMGLSGSELFDPDMQDLMAYHLLKRRGYLDFMSGKIGVVAFAKRLAQEWASFPALAATKGAHGQVARAETDVSGQPRWRFPTANNKNVELHDMYLYWTN